MALRHSWMRSFHIQTEQQTSGHPVAPAVTQLRSQILTGIVAPETGRLGLRWWMNGGIPGLRVYRSGECTCWVGSIKLPQLQPKGWLQQLDSLNCFQFHARGLARTRSCVASRGGAGAHEAPRQRREVALVFAARRQVPRDAQELCGLPSLRRYEGVSHVLVHMAVTFQELEPHQWWVDISPAQVMSTTGAQLRLTPNTQPAVGNGYGV